MGTVRVSDDVAEIRTIAQKATTRFSMTGRLLMLLVLVLVVALYFSGPEGTLQALRQVGAQGIAILLGLACAHYAIRVLRWHVLVRVADVETSFAQNTRHFLGGFAMTATPGRIGELIRLRWLKLETGRRFGSLLPIAYADRAFELVSMVVVIAVALAFANLGTTSTLWLLLVGIAVSIFVSTPRFLTGGLGMAWRLSGRRASRKFAKLRGVVRALDVFLKPQFAVPLVLVGCLGWALEGAAFWLLLNWLGAPLPFGTATAIFLCAILSGALLGLPGGLGGVEASAILLLVLQNVPAETAVLATLVIRVTTLWFAVAIGFLVFPYAEYQASAEKTES